MAVEASRVWFTDLWNYSLVPYLLEAVREGLQVGDRRPAPDPHALHCAFSQVTSDLLEEHMTLHL